MERLKSHSADIFGSDLTADCKVVDNQHIWLLIEQQLPKGRKVKVAWEQATSVNDSLRKLAMSTETADNAVLHDIAHNKSPLSEVELSDDAVCIGQHITVVLRQAGREGILTADTMDELHVENEVVKVVIGKWDDDELSKESYIKLLWENVMTTIYQEIAACKWGRSLPESLGSTWCNVYHMRKWQKSPKKTSYYGGKLSIEK